MDDDDELLRRWKQGEAAAGNILFRRHFALVRRFFRNKLRPEDAEDLMSRTFAACVEGRDRFRGDSSFRTFLFAVARRQLYKHLRDRASRESRRDPDMGVSSIRALGQTPSSFAAARQEHALLLEALQRISVEHQSMLELFYWEQVPGPEIAQVFEISPTTVRTRLYRARQALEVELRTMSVDHGGATPTDLEAAVRAAGAHMR
jgi:RNA polymerase sigma-70 factor (ECF subfamily)